MSWWQVILIVVIVLAVLAIKYLPWWVLVILIALPILGWRYIGAGIFVLMFRRTAGQLGKVLRGATVTVHSLMAVSPPDPKVLEETFRDDDEEDEDVVGDALDEPPEARDWYELEVTIAPQPRDVESGEDDPGGWQAETLALVPPESGYGEFDVTCMIGRIEVEHEGRFRIAGDWCSYGPERLKLLIGVRPGTKQVKFRLFFQDFGEVIELPPPHTRPALTQP